ncbi:MAG: Asp-tRNA(Asn)/Glu-tRNA(Gln) amidotransferase subunit GatB [Patescibacteria group bacterium]|nr:Asp-tRNA(Asn)/Glu-tRNA(Gln) amidotransferase subunit GatB [Patescibacteria group bacterium]
MEKNEFEPVIGLEIHAELKTNSKMFCSCRNDPDERHPNTNICPICTAQPGTLPVINKEAVRKVIKTGLALKCKISNPTKFDRKNYFYPDLPKGYQISQYDMPIAYKGELKLNIKGQGSKSVRITRIHLEEDTGSSIHAKGADYSLVNFNRAGIPLMELVTEPDINSSLEAKKFGQELQLILRYLDVSEANMEKGQLRVEANVSVKPRGSKDLGTKVEIKNLNSFKVVEKAVDYEIKRQAKLLKSGKKVLHETRGWDESKMVTVSQREKEQAHDYRYFPEPDLKPLVFDDNEINSIKAEIPELPSNKRIRFAEEYGLDEDSVEFFIHNKELSEYFEKVTSEFEPNIPQDKLKRLIALAVNYIITDLQSLLKEKAVEGEDFLITPENFAEFISLIENKTILSKVAKTVLLEMFQTGADPSNVIEEKGLNLMQDENEIIGIVKDVILKNERAVLDFKKGKQNAIQFLIGQVMARTKGRVNPETAEKILKDNL